MLNDIVNKLAEQYDDDTFYHSIDKQLFLVGGETPFLKAIKKKAANLGVFCVYKDRVDLNVTPTVVDTEVYKEPFHLISQQDIDRIQCEGISCCANAILAFLTNIDIAGKNITILGRGHAVKGLAEELMHCTDATVTVCHSKTRNLYESTLFADIFVVAAPVKPAQVSSLAGKIVIDVSGTFKGFVPKDRYVSNIGKLTTSILLNRAVK